MNAYSEPSQSVIKFHRDILFFVWYGIGQVNFDQLPVVFVLCIVNLITLTIRNSFVMNKLLLVLQETCFNLGNGKRHVFFVYIPPSMVYFGKNVVSDLSISIDSCCGHRLDTTAEFCKKKPAVSKDLNYRTNDKHLVSFNFSLHPP